MSLPSVLDDVWNRCELGAVSKQWNMAVGRHPWEPVFARF